MGDAGAVVDARLVRDALDGDGGAFATLFERWFARVHDVARNIVRDPDTAADVAQDAFIAAWEGLGRLERPEAFGGWLLRIARNKALNRLEKDRRSRPHEAATMTALHDGGLPDPAGSTRQTAADAIAESHDRDGLVHAAAAVLGERDASLLDLHLRHGLSPAEIADELGVTPNHAHQLLFRMRKRLADAVGAALLWRRGRPACAELAALIAPAGPFDVGTFEVVEHHRRACAGCGERRLALVAPDQLFAAVPLALVPAGVREQVLHGLGAAGVPHPPMPSAGPGRTPVDGGGPGAADAADGAPATGGAPADRTVERATPAGGPVAAASIATATATVAAAGEPRHGRRRAAVLLVSAALLAAATTTVIALAADDATTMSDLAGAAGDTVLTDHSPASSVPAPRPRAGTVPTTASAAIVVAPTAVATTTTGAAAATTTVVAPTATTDLSAPTVTAATAPPVVTVVTLPPPPPAASVTTVPPTSPPPPPSTTAVPPAATTTTLAAPPAKILGFTAGTGPGGVLCAAPGASPRRFQWSSLNGTTATLVIGATERTVAPSGSLDACGASGATATLTVRGPASADDRSIVLP